MTVSYGDLNNSIEYTVAGSTPGSSSGVANTGVGRAVAAGPVTGAPAYPAPGTVVCSGGVASQYGSYGQIMTVSGCGAPTGAAATTPSPPPPPISSIAATYWAQHGANQLPVPRPQIAPGWAICGLPGYLETHIPLTVSFTDPTRLGTLAISAHATIWVDWGDGSGLDGPYDNAGAPWPEGTITHYWTTQGSYDVVVQAHWSATWSLAGASGTLAGLQTASSIPGFAVRQLESVRNY